MFGSKKAAKNPIGSKISMGSPKGIVSVAEVNAPKKGSRKMGR
jgi:hypothetical protein